jgi:hypothetical protein
MHAAKKGSHHRTQSTYPQREGFPQLESPLKVGADRVVGEGLQVSKSAGAVLVWWRTEESIK